MRINLLKVGLLISNLVNPTKSFLTPSTSLVLKQMQTRKADNGPFTLNAKKSDDLENEPLNQESALPKYVLNKDQLIGIIQFGLTMKQVLSPNFGPHTLKAIRFLKKGNPEITNQEAFAIVEGLPKSAIKSGLAIYFSTREKQNSNLEESLMNSTDFSNPSYNNEILETMSVLQSANPKADDIHIYKFVMGMKDYERLAILEFGLTLAQVGIGISDNHFVKQNPENPNFSKDTIKTLKFLKSKGLVNPTEDALNIAINLSLVQVKAFYLYNLSFEEIDSKLFKDSEKLIESILTKIEKPYKLTKEQQVKARIELDKIFQNIKNQNILKLPTSSTNDLEDMGIPTNRANKKNPQSSTKKNTSENNDKGKKTTRKKRNGRNKR